MIIQPANRLSDVQEYYFSTKLREIKQMQNKGLDVINLGIGSPDLSPSEETIKALIESAENPKNHAYQPYKGSDELRTAIKEWYKNTYNVELNIDNEILPLLGSKEGIMHISMAFLNPHDKVLVPDPGYPTYSSVSKLVGAEIITYDLNEDSKWYPNLVELEKKDLTNVKLMWLNYPHMPTGTKANKDQLKKIVDFAKEHKILICHDNPYSLVLNTEKPISIFNIEGAKDVAIELNSLSKSHNMAGWRVGWISGEKAYIDTILKFKSNIDSGMFLPVQDASVQALKNSESWHDERNKQYEERRAIVWDIMNALNCSFDKNQEGMFVWAKVPDNIENTELFVEDILQKALVFITPGFIFGKNGSRYIRISLCTDLGRLKSALERIKDFIKK